MTSTVNHGDTVAQGTPWTVSISPTAERVELWANGSRLADHKKAPYTVQLNLAAGKNRLGVAVTHNGVRKTLGSGGVVAEITVTKAAPSPPPPPPPSPPSPPPPPPPAEPQNGNLAPNPSFEQSPSASYFTNGPGQFSWTSERARSGRSLKIASTRSAQSRWLTKTTAIRAEAGRRYSASIWIYATGMRGSARLALTFWNSGGRWLGVSEDSKATGSTGWRQLSVVRTAPAGTSFVRVELRHTGVGTSWWDDVSLTSSSARVSDAARAQDASGAHAGAFRWDGRSFASARDLRQHLRRRGVQWNSFLVRHPAVAAAFELRAVEWDGKQFYTRRALRQHLVRTSISYGAWAVKHTAAAETLIENAVAEMTRPARAAD
jgi:hypothetical protein